MRNLKLGLSPKSPSVRVATDLEHGTYNKSFEAHENATKITFVWLIGESVTIFCDI